MPENIQDGGVGKGHWSEKQKKIDAIEGKNAAVDAAEQKEKETPKADDAKAEKKDEGKTAEAPKSDAAAPAKKEGEATADTPPADKEAAELEQELMAEGEDEDDKEDDDDDDDDDDDGDDDDDDDDDSK